MAPTTVAVCGTLVADIRVRPFDPVDAARHGDLRDVDEVRLAVGGLVGNTGMALARLGVSTAALGRLGDDPIGDVMAAELVRAGVLTNSLTREPNTLTSTVLVCVDGAGERTFHVAPGVNPLFGADDLEREWRLLTGANAVLLGYLGLLPRLDPRLPALLARLRRDTTALLVLETAGPQRKTRALLDQCLPFLDIFFPSWSEARDLTGAHQPIDALADLARVPGPGILGIKLGSAGCLVRTEQGTVSVPTTPVDAVDATGAGDVFLAGLVAALLSGCDAPTACAAGNRAAALAV
ncbi:MAG: carbohydrate kinase family protein, partial [Chloroflexota bacterium]